MVKRVKVFGATTRVARPEAPKLSAHKRGYSARWASARKGFLNNNPLCAACEASGMVRGADVVDHIIPHKMDKGLFWDRDNWQPLCKWHHDVVKQALELAYNNKRLGSEALKANSNAFQNETLRRGGGV